MALGKLPDEEAGEDAIFSEINITPLTDIFLVLLIMFMVGSTIAVENLADEDYRIHGSGQNEAGRQLVAALVVDL